MKVLVVDDSGVMRRIVINALATAGITDVAQAADGNEAVAAGCTNEFDAILMDWNMPNLNGLEALRQLRGMGVTSAVLMVTTESEKARVLDALKAGANNYLVKPFEPAALVAKLQAAMGQTARPCA